MKQRVLTIVFALLAIFTFSEAVAQRMPERRIVRKGNRQYEKANYDMDSTNNTDENSIKIVKIDRSKLETDRANCREDVAVVGNAFAVYGMTRTFYPDGLIVWTQQEPNASYTPGRYILQFYDYATKKMYPIAYFDTSSIANSEYIGFFAGAKTQHCESGVIIAKPTRPLHQAKYGDSYVSTHIGLNLTM